MGEVISNPFLKKNLNYNASSGHSFTRFKQVKNIKNIDILFLGASNAYRGFDTRIFEQNNYKVFNLGSSSQTPLQTELLLKRYLKQLNPKIIIYAVNADAFCSDGIESSLDLISNDIIDFEMIKLALSQNHIKLYNTLIYSLYKDITGHLQTYKQPAIIDNDKYIDSGFIERENSNYEYRNYISSNWNFNKKQFKAFTKAVELIKVSGAKLYLVQPPIVNAKYKSFTNNYFFDNKMSTYGKYDNYNLLLNINDTMFYDENHLNKYGVDIFNNALLSRFILEN